jgi:hypothetical protein
MVERLFFIDLTFKSISNQILFAISGTICAVCVYRAFLALSVDCRIQEFFKHLTVILPRIGHSEIPNQLVRLIGFYMVFAAVLKMVRKVLDKPIAGQRRPKTP